MKKESSTEQVREHLTEQGQVKGQAYAEAQGAHPQGQAKKVPLFQSFGYAFEGIRTGIVKERNMKIHCTAAILVTMAGTLFGLTATEWCICILLFGLVMSLELVNTAVEAVVDLVTEERKPLAKIAKDTAAGAVLIAAIAAAVIGCIIFLPHVREILVWIGLL